MELLSRAYDGDQGSLVYVTSVIDEAHKETPTATSVGWAVEGLLGGRKARLIVHKGYT